MGDIQSQREAEQSDKFNAAVSKTVGAALDPTLLKKSLNDAERQEDENEQQIENLEDKIRGL